MTSEKFHVRREVETNQEGEFAISGLKIDISLAKRSVITTNP